MSLLLMLQSRRVTPATLNAPASVLEPPISGALLAGHPTLQSVDQILSTRVAVSPSSTYWYLTAAPELVGLAAQRLERSLGELP